MNKRAVFLIGVAAVMATLYVTNFTDAWKTRNIHIMWRILPASGTTDPTIEFYLDKPYPLTSVKVVESDEALTNKYAHPLWFLVAASNAAMTKAFAYGAAIPGMKPDVPLMKPEPLQPDTSYALIVQAGKSMVGKTTFHL